MNIEKIQPNVALAILFCLSSFFITVLSFFLLTRGLFNSLNLWQFVGIGIGLSFPILLLNIIVSSLFEDEGDGTDAHLANLGSGGVVTSIILTSCLLISYWQSFTLKTYYWIVFFVEVALLIVAFINNRIEHKKKKKTV